MRKVYHLAISIDELKLDVYFEDQETAESMINFIEATISEKAKKRFKYEANVHEVHTRESAMLQIAEGFGMAIKDKK